MTQQRTDLLEKWKADPWAFLTAKDPETDEPIIKTVDQRDNQQTVKGFPAHLDYLHYLVDVLHNEPKVAIEKASQMIITTTIALDSAHGCAFGLGYKVLLSKHKEEEAEIILAEKVRTPWSLMPRWLQMALPATRKPKNRVIWTGEGGVESSILGMTETAAAGEARGQTYHRGLIDEAEYQEQLRDLITAMLPRTGQIVIWSTPARGGDGVQVFRDYLGDDVVTLKGHPSLWAIKKKWAFLPGVGVRRNEKKGFTILRIEHSADPAKRSKEWEQEAQKGYPSRSDFLREMKIDRTSNAGRPFYPQFSERPRKYTLKCTQLPPGPIIRGWDFGGANPACIWVSWSKKSKRAWVLRELLGYDIDTYQFRDLVKYVSGQLTLESLQKHTRAMQMLEDHIKANPDYPEPPWFGGAHRFLDFAGHEGKMGARGLVRDEDKRTAQEILALGDIHLYTQFTYQAARKEIIDGLSRLRMDGWPGLIIDPHCPLLWTGLTTGIVYARATPGHPDPVEPAKDATYSHLHDALGYALTNIVSTEDADFFQASLGPDGQLIVPEELDEQVSSYLTEGY